VCLSSSKILDLAEQVADIFGETKYSTSFFNKGKKLGVNEKIGDLNIGFTDASKVD
jgi:hypothetical protein